MKYPVVLLGYCRTNRHDFSKPSSTRVVYDDIEKENIVTSFNQRNFDIRTRKPKLNELHRFNFWQKLYYYITFKSPVTNTRVEVFRIILAIAVGYCIGRFIPFI